MYPFWPWKSTKYYVFSMCVCSLIYPEYNARAPYNIVICGLSASTAFFHIILQTTLFSKWKLLSIECVLWFCLQRLSETFHIIRRTHRDIIVNVFVWSVCYFYEILINPLNPELNPICYLLALLEAYHFLHVSRIRVKLLTFRWLMSYIYGAPILDVSRSHTTTQHSR